MADLLDCEGEPQVREHLVFLHAVSSLPPEMYTLSSHTSHHPVVYSSCSILQNF